MKNFLTLGEITRILDGEFYGDEKLLNEQVRHITYEEIKTTKDGSTLFFPFHISPYKCSKFSNKAMENAHNKGAVCVTDGTILAKPPYILIDKKRVDELVTRLLSAIRQNATKPIIAVAGSVGKTTTVDMLYAVLSEKYNVLKTNYYQNVPGTNFENLYSLLTNQADIGIFEIAEGPNDIVEINAKILQPDIVLLTTIGLSHLSYFKTQDAIFEDISKLITYMSAAGKVYANGDCPYQSKITVKPAQTVVFTGERKNIYFAKDIKSLHEEGKGQSFRLHIEESVFDAKTCIPGKHLVFASLASATVARDLGLTTVEITKGIEKFKPSAFRSQIYKTAFIDIIEDVYNSSPESMKAAIDTLAGIPDKRKVLIFGDMAQLGEDEIHYHQEVAMWIIENDIDFTIYIGKHIEEIESIFINAPEKVKCYENRYQVHFDLPNLIQKNDIVLLKASRSMHFEYITNVLRSLSYKNKIQAIPLVRASNAAVMDYAGNILFDKNMHIKRSPASITKVLTCLIALDHMDLHDTLTIVDTLDYGYNLKVAVGEQFNVLDALYGLMLNSANDIAINIAINIAGDIRSFSKLMNKKAKYLGMTNSNFKNPYGKHEAGHLSTAYDLCLLMRYAMEYPHFNEIINTPEHNCFSSVKPYIFKQTNEMILAKKESPERRYRSSVGGKTGSLKFNGKYVGMLASCAEKEGINNIVVQLSVSGEDFAETYIKFDDAKRLHEYAFRLQAKDGG